MRAFLRDLAFLALFAAAVAAVVLVVFVHQGRFSATPSDATSIAEPATDVTEVRPAPMADNSDTPASRHAAATAEPRATPPGATTAYGGRAAPADDGVFGDSLPMDPATFSGSRGFDPSTRGAPGDARVLCLPEIAWLQRQLDRWAGEARASRRSPPATLADAHAAARRAAHFTYQVSPECWNEPTRVEARGWGDCADKSLWLARELLQAGYEMVGVRLGVPEDYEPGQPGHAWVVLYHHGSEWIYDPAASPRLTSQDAGPAKRFRITATVFPRASARSVQAGF